MFLEYARYYGYSIVPVTSRAPLSSVYVLWIQPNPALAFLGDELTPPPAFAW